jgi:hypothetical protein
MALALFVAVRLIYQMVKYLKTAPTGAVPFLINIQYYPRPHRWET